MQQLNRYILLSFTVLSVNALAQTEPIVVDDEKADFTGRWQTVAEKASVGGQFKYAMNGEEAEASSTVTFRPNIPVSGKYNVEVSASSGGNRSPKVPCVISSANGESYVIMDQTKRPGGWQRIAENVEFNSGTSGFVQLRNNGGPMPVGKVVVADAVRFIPVEDNGKAFQLTATADAGGNVVLNPKKRSFEPDSIVTLNAHADDGYAFSGWSGDASSMENPLHLKMNKAKRVNATFVEAPAGAIMDASEAKFVGNWIPNPGRWGARTNYQFASTCIKEGDPKTFASATYQPNLSKDGLYDIYIWYSKGTNRADNAPWEIAGKNKSFTVNVNQQVHGGDWFPIANGVEFEAGKKGHVKVFNATGSLNSVVVADSVAFVYVGKPQ